MDLVLGLSEDHPRDDAPAPLSRYGPAMNGAAVWMPQRVRLRPRRAVVLPVILAGLVQVDIWGGRLALGHMVGPRPVIALLYTATSLSLIWSRSAPLAVLAFIVTADSAVYLAFGAPEGLGSFLPLLFAFYAVGRYSQRGNVVFAAPLVFAGIAIHELTDPVYSFGGSDAVFYAGVAAGWPLGYAFQRRAVEKEALVEAQEQTARAAVAGERSRIARELHDVVGHGLSVVVLQLVAALGQVDRRVEADLRKRLEDVERSARETLAEMRRLLDLIDDGGAPELAPQPGLDQLDRLVADTRVAGASVEVEVAGERRLLAPGIELAAYRILQESLTNVLKHARPPCAYVRISYEPTRLVLEIDDKGEARTTHVGGRGLAGMRERVAVYGGRFQAGPRPNGGFSVHAVLPMG